jgi:hypothetical protein
MPDLSDRLPLIMNIRAKLRKMLLGKQVEQKFKLIKSIFRNRGIYRLKQETLVKII